MKFSEVIKENINEGDDRNMADVKKNHPDVYKFADICWGFMAADRATVEAYNTAGQHMVVMKSQPSASLENTKLALRDAGVSFVERAGMLVGETKGFNFTISQTGQRGNMIEVIRASIPHENDEIATYHDRTMEAEDTIQQEEMSELVEYIEGHLEDIVEGYSKYATGDSTQPAAPNTAVFKANVKGMIEVVKHVNTPASKYGFPRHYAIGIKVGGNVDYKVHKAIKGELKEFWDHLLEAMKDHQPEVVKGNFVVTDKGNVFYDQKEGTSWSIYGFAVDK